MSDNLGLFDDNPGLFDLIANNLHFRSLIRTFELFPQLEGRLYLGNTQINLVFRSICTTFADA